ncbi:cytosolic protein [Ectobacillus panaciterrae]|uniref:cytosolic protein n=1 Tax=Ectobacillus panaciterrae TaxID=363872 RepID=UPI0003F81B92|nr:cytosolic protein [Ectobacillus panaciterrae]
MSIIAKVKQFFTTQAETTDTHKYEQLRSRYYKTNTQNALKVTEEMLQGIKDCRITSVSPERGEISAAFTGKTKALLVVTVVTIRPFETAVDFMVFTETVLPTDFGFSKRLIIDLYNMLDKRLVFIGTGLGQKL